MVGYSALLSRHEIKRDSFTHVDRDVHSESDLELGVHDSGGVVAISTPGIERVNGLLPLFKRKNNITDIFPWVHLRLKALSPSFRSFGNYDPYNKTRTQSKQKKGSISALIP